MHILVFLFGLISIYAVCAMFVVYWPSISRPNEWQALASSYSGTYEAGLSVNCWISLRYPPYSQPLFVSKSGEFADGRLTVRASGDVACRNCYSRKDLTGPRWPVKSKFVSGREGQQPLLCLTGCFGELD